MLRTRTLLLLLAHFEQHFWFSPPIKFVPLDSSIDTIVVPVVPFLPTGIGKCLAVTPSPYRLRSLSIVNKCGVANHTPTHKLRARHSLPITPLSLIPNGEQLVP